MKQNIIQLSNIRTNGDTGLRKLADATQTFVYEDCRRKYPDASKEQLIAISHRGYALAVLHNCYDWTYDTECIVPTDVRYQEAADEIETYIETDWMIDDSDAFQSGALKTLDATYTVTHQHTLFMYFDDWTQHGYEAFLGVADWDKAFEQVIYEYMRRFLTVDVS